MALFPKIQNPCPYQDRLASIMDGDVCRMCERKVFDLTAMSDGERVAFMEGCSGDVCVSYRLPVLAAAALAMATIAAPGAALACSDVTTIVVTAGGIKDARNVQYVSVETAADRATPRLPVSYEDKPADPAPRAMPPKQTAP